MFAAWALVFSATVSILSMLTTVFLNVEGFEWLSHSLVVIFGLGFPYGLLARCKLHLNHPSFGSACSLVALTVSIMCATAADELTDSVCREGAVHLGRFESDAIQRTLTVVTIGVICSDLVGLCLWPRRAVSELVVQVDRCLETLGDLFAQLGRTFLDDPRSDQTSDASRALTAHRAAFASMRTTLDAAQLETFDRRIVGLEALYARLVISLERLGQHLAGALLRSPL